MRDVSLMARARETERYTGALCELGGHLPDDDEALDAVLGECVRDRDDEALTNLLLAAFHAKRNVDARILAEGVPLLGSPYVIIAAAVHCTGDTGGALLEAARRARLDRAVEALVLVLCAWWSRERAGREVPAEVVRRGRVLARRPLPMFARTLLLALSDLAADPHLEELIAGLAPLPQEAAASREVVEGALEEARRDPLHRVPAERPRTLLTGYTVRRAVARIGRNEPCPCGSGKKYKRCCHDKDRERLLHSSDVEGLTLEELRERPEPHVTRERLDAMSPNELARLDPSLLDPALLPILAHRLTWSHELEAVATLFESVGHLPQLGDYFYEAVEEAVDLGQAELARRLLATVGDREVDLEQLALPARIVAEGLEPGPVLERIESKARESLDAPLGPLELAHELMAGPSPALGILVARSALWSATSLDAWALLDRLLETRDRLGLPPRDPVEEWLDGRRPADDEPPELTLEDEQTQAELQSRLAEARRLRIELRERDRALRRMEGRLEKVEARTHAPADPERAAGEDVVADLRRRLAERKAELKRKHAERNALDAELERARSEIETLRARASAAAANRASTTSLHDDENDDSLLLPEEAPGRQPPRLPRFRRQFEDDLRRVPAAVASACLRLIGRLAAGEDAAFRGARRLQSQRETWRQRVGASHRLLFRCEDDEIAILGLVTRQDFERAVRAL